MDSQWGKTISREAFLSNKSNLIEDFSIILTKESFICDKLYCDNEESEWKVTEGEDEYEGEIRKFILIEKAFLTYKKS